MEREVTVATFQLHAHVHACTSHLNESHALLHGNPIDSSDTSDLVVIICFTVIWRKESNEFSQELSAFSTETFRVEISRVDFGTDFEN